MQDDKVCSSITVKIIYRKNYEPYLFGARNIRLPDCTLKFRKEIPVCAISEFRGAQYVIFSSPSPLSLFLYPTSISFS